jgi:hypothetical protein
MPGHLPEGEKLLWQGAPDWRVLARTAMHTRVLAIYFGAIACIAAVTGSGVLGGLKVVGVGLVPLALAYGYAFAVSRGSVYSITNRRVVLHIGLALPVTLNLPLERVAAADLRAGPDGAGDLSLTLAGPDRFSYVVLWPHARPWRFSPAQPTMRGLANAAEPAQILAQALAPSANLAMQNCSESEYDTMQTPLAA